MSESPDDIVGHKTFDTGEICPETGFPLMRHEPLTRAEGEALWQRAKQCEAERAERMPDERAAISALFDAHQRLKELGWKEPQYCPKNGTTFKVIELGSTGIFDCYYQGEWPDGMYMVSDERDIYPTSTGVAMFKLLPEDQAKEDERWKKAREKFLSQATDTTGSDGDSSSAAETVELSGEPMTGTRNAEASSASGLAESNLPAYANPAFEYHEPTGCYRRIPSVVGGSKQ